MDLLLADKKKRNHHLAASLPLHDRFSFHARRSPPMSTESSTNRFVIGILFAATGAAALVYQVVWQRVLTQEVGADSISSALIVGIFLGGISIGSLVGGFASKLLPASRVRLFCLAQVLIGCFSMSSVGLIRLANRSLDLGDSHFGDFLANAIALAIPTCLMGMTAPLMVDIAKDRLANFGRIVGVFYGLNILGAAIGVLASGFVLIELIGLTWTARLAGVVDIVAGLIVLAVARGMDHSSKPATAWLNGKAFAASVLFGFATIAMEMILFRTLANHLTLLAVIFPGILCAFLLSMACGEVVGGFVADQSVGKQGLALSVLVLASAVLLVLAYRFPHSWFELYTYGRMELGRKALLSAGIFFLPVVALTAVFPVVVKTFTPTIDSAGQSFGLILFAYGIGNSVAALVVPLIFFGSIGTIWSAVSAIASATLGAVLLGGNKAIAFATVGVSLLMPFGYFTHSRGFDLSDVAASETYEDDIGVVSVFKAADRTQIRTFRTPTATVMHTQERSGKYRMEAILDADQSLRLERVLVLGLGGANWLPQLIERSEVKEVVAVELSPTVAELVRKHGGEAYDRAFRSEKLKLVIDDGRRFVRNDSSTYDMVQLGVYQPWMAGTGNLYTKEFMQDIRRLMRPGGVLCTIDLAMIAETALTEFKSVAWIPGNEYLYFYEEPAASLRNRMQNIVVADNASHPFGLLSDDRPASEYFFVKLAKGHGNLAALDLHKSLQPATQ